MVSGQVGGGAFGSVLGEVGVDFFVDVDEAGRNGLVGVDGKGEAVGDAGSVVGVLTEDDDLDFIEVGGEGAKNLGFGREDSGGGVGLMQESTEFLEIGFGELRFKKGFPAGVHEDIIAQKKSRWAGLFRDHEGQLVTAWDLLVIGADDATILAFVEDGDFALVVVGDGNFTATGGFADDDNLVIFTGAGLVVVDKHIVKGFSADGGIGVGAFIALGALVAGNDNEAVGVAVGIREVASFTGSIDNEVVVVEVFPGFAGVGFR